MNNQIQEFSTIVIYDNCTRINYTSNEAAERALSEYFGHPVKILEVQAAAYRIALTGRSAYPMVTHV